MREIEFRGKRKDDGEWVYGYYVKLFTESLGWNGPETTDYLIYTGENECISSNFERGRTHNEVAFAVDPETVGQYTGETDMDGTKIYEGDVVKCYSGSETIGVVRYLYASYRIVGVGGYDEPLKKTEDWVVVGGMHDLSLMQSLFSVGVE